MNSAFGFRPGAAAGAVLLVAPMLIAAFCPALVERLSRWVPHPFDSSSSNGWESTLPRIARLAAPALLCLPYAMVAGSFGIFRWSWFALYAVLPLATTILLERARESDPGSRGNWRDFVVLLALGLAVDLRWFEPAWPRGLAALGKMLLLDAGIFGFLVVRRLDQVGFDLRLTWQDLRHGLGEYLLYAVIALPLGLWLGFLHLHAILPSPWRAIGAFVFTFVFIAIPEELFFRGWLQNLLERRLGRIGALLVTAAIFGLSHWNKRAIHFNWRYVLMAAIAGIFYGRAWLAQRRVGASALTHASVDTTWSLWLR